jgi:hypothetical protein
MRPHGRGAARRIELRLLPSLSTKRPILELLRPRLAVTAVIAADMSVGDRDDDRYPRMSTTRMAV